MRTFPSLSSNALTLSTLMLVAAAGCTEDDAGAAAQLKAEELLQVSTPVEVTSNGFVAPPGDFNMFAIYAAYETVGCGLSDHVYGILGPSGVRVEDCPECLLPAEIDLGAPPADFDVFASHAGSQGSEQVDDVAGMEVSDLVFEQPLCGEYVTALGFTVVFEHLNTTAYEEPRTFITATATFTISAAGVIEPTSDWTRCIEDAEGAQCTGPDGVY